MASVKPGGSKSPPPVMALAKDDPRRAAAAAEYQQKLATLDLGALEDLEVDTELEREPEPREATSSASRDEPEPELEPEPQPEPRREPKRELKRESAPSPSPARASAPEPARASGPDLELELEPPSREPSATRRPNLEPIADEAHPPENRRLPTQPPSAFEQFLEESGIAAPGAPQPSNKPLELAAVRAAPRHSPTPVRRGLFSPDRVTNMVAGAAVGLLLAVFPAKKLAESYETREVEPRLGDLESSIEQTLGVQAGLVERPEAIAADIDAGRRRVRVRFTMIWLLAGLPIGLGLGFAPRPGD